MFMNPQSVLYFCTFGEDTDIHSPGVYGRKLVFMNFRKRIIGVLRFCYKL